MNDPINSLKETYRQTFMNAPNPGILVNSRTKEFAPKDISLITETDHNLRKDKGGYSDVPGFCKSGTIKETETLIFVITPDRFVGLANEEDGFNFVRQLQFFKTLIGKTDGRRRPKRSIYIYR